MKIDNVDVPEIRQSDLYALLEEEENLMIYGNKGVGKSSIVRKYAKDKSKQLLILSLATMLPEFIGGIPYAQVSDDKKAEYFILLLNKSLAPMLKVKGKNWIIFLDEITQSPTEVMNCLYSICHIDPSQREWCGHSLEFAQIVAASNLTDGTDGTVYLNELPGPLHDRFFVYQLVSDDKDVMDYLKKKYKNIPQVTKYIKVMQREKINPRNIDKCLELLQFKKNPLLLRTKLGDALTREILDLQKGLEATDPTELLKKCRVAYERFKQDGGIKWKGGQVITDENELLDKFKELLSDEEVASIMKGSENHE